MQKNILGVEKPEGLQTRSSQMYRPPLQDLLTQDLRARVADQMVYTTPPKRSRSSSAFSSLRTRGRGRTQRRVFKRKQNPYQNVTATAYRVPRSIGTRPEIKNLIVDSLVNFGKNTVWHPPELLVDMPLQGVGNSQRIGNRIFALWVDVFMVFRVETPAAVPLTGTLIVSDIWLDRRANAQVVASSNIYEHPNEGVMSHQLSRNYSRFKRLTRRESYVEVTQRDTLTNLASVVNIVGYHQFRIPLNMSMQSFDDAAEILDHRVFLTCVSKDPSIDGLVDPFVMDFKAKLFFTDA